MRFFKIGVLILFLTQVSLQTSFAQESFKIAIISLSKVFDNYEKTKAVDKELEKKGKEKNAERDKMVKVMNKMKDETVAIIFWIIVAILLAALSNDDRTDTYPRDDNLQRK